MDQENGPRQVLKGVRGIREPGAKIKVLINEAPSGWRTVEIIANREGLRSLAAICRGLSDSDEAQDSHYHLDEIFWGTEKGSTDLVIYKEEL